MKKILIVTIVLAIAAVALGALAVTPEVPIVKIRPLYEHLIESPQNWKNAYGDTLEARFIYNLAILRSNQLEIARMISRLHPPIEPNVPTLESRIDDLETKINSINCISEFYARADIEDRVRCLIKEINKLAIVSNVPIDPNEVK